MTTVNYMTPTQAQLLGGQMTASPNTPAQSVTNSPAMGGVPQMSPQMMQQLLSGMGSQNGLMGLGMNNANSYVDPNGDSVAQGAPFSTQANNGAYSYGPNQSGLSGGTQFSPQDLQTLQGMFNG